MADGSASMDRIVNYQASPTLARFHASSSYYRIVIGPAGSGKSVGVGVLEPLRLLQDQPIQRDGWRRARLLVVRNTMPELRRTTMRTFSDWLQSPIAAFTKTPPLCGIFRARIGGVPCELEYDFLSADDDDRVKQLKSYECTWLYLNECVELPKSVFDAASRAVGRYPRKEDGGVTRPCIIGDTNSCDTDHWLYHLAEEEKPEGFTVFKQPGALLIKGKDENGKPILVPNPAAENIANLPGGYEYYRRMAIGKSITFIKVFVCNQYGDATPGRPCLPTWDEDRNERDDVPFLRGLPLRLCWDYGRTPACGVYQLTIEGQMRCMHELLVDPKGDGMAVHTFAKEVVLPFLAAQYPGVEIISSIGDPAGAAGGQQFENSCEDVLRELGLPTISAPNNDPLDRIDAIEQRITGVTRSGEPKFLMSRKGCPVSIRGARGKWKFARARIEGSEGLYRDTPVKNEYSHPWDAWGYGALGTLVQHMEATTRQMREVEKARRYGT